MRAYNKISRIWTNTIDGTELVPTEDWLVDPVFANEVYAMEIGQKYWTFSGNTINTPTPEEYAALKVAEDKLTIWKEIQTIRDTRKSNGVQVGANWFHSDDTSRIQYIGLLMYGAGMPTGIMWKTMTGTFVEMTPTLAQQIFGSIAAKDTAIFTVAETHRALLNASNSPSTYNYLTGAPAWPLMFGE